jgi:hypothetical protein
MRIEDSVTISIIKLGCHTGKDLWLEIHAHKVLTGPRKAPQAASARSPGILTALRFLFIMNRKGSGVSPDG